MNLPILVVSALLLLPAPARAQGSTPPVPDVLVTVDGLAIRREDVAKRIWIQYASAGLNQIVDEHVVNKAVTAWRAKQSKKQQQAAADEVAARIKRVKSQFKDEGAFEESLKKNGATLAELETRLREQVERERLIISAKNISVAPAEIREFYDANKGKLGGPPSVRLRHMLAADEKQAQDLLISVRAGADFAKLAAQKSLDAGTKDKGGDLGFVTAGNLPPEVENRIFGLKDGEVSEVLWLPDGFHLFKAEEHLVPKDPPFEAAQKDISEAIIGHKINRAWPAYLAELRKTTKIVPSPGVTMAPPAMSIGAARP